MAKATRYRRYLKITKNLTRITNDIEGVTSSKSHLIRTEHGGGIS